MKIIVMEYYSHHLKVKTICYGWGYLHYGGILLSYLPNYFVPKMDVNSHVSNSMYPRHKTLEVLKLSVKTACQLDTPYRLEELH